MLASALARALRDRQEVARDCRPACRNHVRSRCLGDEFGFSYTRRAGVSGIEGKPGPTHDVVLTWATFTEAADESGMSRRYGGVHFEDADLEGRALGRRVATLSWNKAQSYISGAETAKPAPVSVSGRRLGNDDFPPPEKAGVQRECSRTEACHGSCNHDGKGFSGTGIEQVGEASAGNQNHAGDDCQGDGNCGHTSSITRNEQHATDND